MKIRYLVLYIILIFILPPVLTVFIYNNIFTYIELPIQYNLTVNIISYLLTSMAILGLIYLKKKEELSYWLLIIMTILTSSFSVGSILYHLGDSNAGSYAVATASTLGLIITLFHNKKGAEKAFKINETQMFLKFEYDSKKDSLIKLHEYLKKKLEEYKLTSDLKKFDVCLEELISEKHYYSLPENIRRDIEEVNQKYFANTISFKKLFKPLKITNYSDVFDDALKNLIDIFEESWNNYLPQKIDNDVKNINKLMEKNSQIAKTIQTKDIENTLSSIDIKTIVKDMNEEMKKIQNENLTKNKDKMIDAMEQLIVKTELDKIEDIMKKDLKDKQEFI